jgi:CBS domain-containing protein
MGTVRSILASKTIDQLLTTTREELVFDAISVMAENSIGSLVVVDGDEVVGIVTERDYLRKVAVQGRSSRETPVSTIMSSPVITVLMSATIERCMTLMTANRCRHLPVLGDDGGLIGVVSIGDCVKRMVQEQKDEINFLNEYIAGPART